MTGRITRAPFTGLLSGYLISVLGTAMSALAIPWLVLTTTGSAGRTGLVAFAEMAPYVTLQALGGPLVDRFGARRAFLVGNSVAALATCAIPALYQWGNLGFGTLLALIAVAGTVRGVADCANNVLVPGTAGLAGMPLERVTGLFSTASSIGLLVGSPLAAGLAATIGSPAVILIDGLTFAFAVVVVAIFVPVSAQPPADTDDRLTARRYLAQLREGLGFIRGDRLLLAIVVMVGFTNLVAQGLAVVMLPVWVHRHLGGPGGLGFLVGALGAGAVVGALGGSWLGPRLPRWRTYAWGFLAGGSAPFVALAVFTTLPVPVAVFAFAGLASGMLNPILGAVQYERIPPRLRARVMGAVKASSWLGIPFGSLLAGLAVDGVGVRAALFGAGTVMFLATLAPFVFPSWRAMDRTPAAAPTNPPVAAPATT